MYTIELFSGRQYPDGYAIKTATAPTQRQARQIAARMLGHKSLRGASTWDRYQGGTVYKFGPRRENTGYDFVVIDCEQEHTS